MKNKKTKTKAEKIIKELDPQIKSFLEAKKDSTPAIIFETDTKRAMFCLMVRQKSPGRYCEEISKTLVDVLEGMMELIDDKERARYKVDSTDPDLIIVIWPG